ncbi:MAG: amidohydrolase family protein [Thauera sp.]|nr:amidohydrolase family protein [Thauera sp.]MBP7525229.1 amidohydrolase family protein [Propionivibrio sp.]
MTIAARKILFATLLPAITGFALFHGGNTFAEGGFTKADTHTHAWVNCYDATKSGGGVDTSGCAPAPRRYTPEGVLPYDKLQAEWQKNDIDYGVLVQVSFMGTDNSYLVDLVEKHDNIRGVVVLTNADGSLNEASYNDEILQHYHDIGIRGIRLNLQGKKPDEMAVINAAMDMESGTPGFKKLWEFIRSHDWHIEAHGAGEQWVDLIATLLKTNCRVVVDHFARPDKQLNLDDPGWKIVLKAGETGRVWMKVSGSYRLGVNDETMMEYVRLAKEHFGINRLLWGSDYPYTGCKDMPMNCEDSQDYAVLFNRFETWFPSKLDQRVILQDNPAEVFGFPLTKN